MSPALRERLLAGLGIECVRRHGGRVAELAGQAASLALERAGVAPNRVRLIVDFSTLPNESDGLWSLANWLQADLDCSSAATLSARGAGCAGLHLALRTTLALMSREPLLDVALLIAADQVGERGRSCLPVSILGDGAGALVIGTEKMASPSALPIRAVACSTLGLLQDIIRLTGERPALEIDGAAFERRVAPLHFVLSQRVLSRALVEAGARLEDLGALVYPNTTALDRQSVCRALGLDPADLSGPGPRTRGHVFASDLVINLEAPSPSGLPSGERPTALLAVGSGFTWGACIVGG